MIHALSGETAPDARADAPARAPLAVLVRAYGQSKLANLMFTYELQRRLAAAGAQTSTLAAHPGSSWTELQRHLPFWMDAIGRLLPSHPPARGALPALRAATHPAARGGEYYGPGGRGEMTGSPAPVESSARSRDIHAQDRLWELSEQLTGVTYQIPGRAPRHTAAPAR